MNPRDALPQHIVLHTGADVHSDKLVVGRTSTVRRSKLVQYSAPA